MECKIIPFFNYANNFFMFFILRFKFFLLSCIENSNYMAEIETKTPEELIVEHLENNGQMMSWLADKVGVTAGHLHSVLKGKDNAKRDLTDENLKKINEALGTNFKK